MAERRKDLRKNTTFEEGVMWKLLKNYLKDFKFRRQYSVGRYVLDFYCVSKRLAIELDGKHHLNQKEYDEERDLFLKDCNIDVLRFWNEEVRENPGEIIQKIRTALGLQSNV